MSMTRAPKRMLIVGAATGIGAAGAGRLASDGWRLALLDIASEPLQKVATQTGSIAITVDAADRTSCSARRRACSRCSCWSGMRLTITVM